MWAGLAGLVSIACLSSSLLGRLGYAFGFAVTPVLALAALHLGTRAEGRLGRALLAWLPVGAVPLVVMAASAPFSRSCGVASGLRWYALQPVASSITAAIVGVALVRRWPTRGARLAWAWPLATLLVALVFLYRHLPVFAYDPFWGYFPGSLYDEQVSVRPAFYWARLYHLVAALALWAVAARRRPIALGLLAATTALALLAPQLGFRQTTASITAALGGRRDTAHFSLHVPAATSAATLDRLADECEFRYARLVELLGHGPPRITIFLFDSVESKQRWTGLQGTSIARPWQAQIVTHGLGVPHDSLNHELVHAFFGEYGDPLFGLPWRGLDIASGLVEGVAVALDDDDSDDEVHGLAQTMRKSHQLPPVSELLSLRFLLHPPTRAYTAAGSFCRFLVRRQGGRELAALYHGGAREAVLQAQFGRSLAELERDWWQFLDARPLPPVTAESRDALSRPSIFARRCAHELATKRQAAFAAMGADVDRGLGLLQAICAEDPERPEHLTLVLREALARRRPLLAERTAWALLAHPQASEKHLAQAAEALGDLTIQRGDRFTALGYFALAGRAPAEPGVARLRVVKQHAAGLPAGELAESLVKYLYQDGGKREQAAKLVALQPEVGLYAYLLGRQLQGRAAVEALERSQRLGLPDARFVKEALRLGIEQALAAQAFPEAARFASALVEAGEPSGAVWGRRIAFLAARAR